MVELRIHDLCVELDSQRIIDGLSLRIERGELVAMLGCNGAGKSTVLRTIVGQVPRHCGTITIAGADPMTLGAKRLARCVSYLPQSRHLAWPLRVRDVVALGRFAHGAPMHALKGRDARAVDAAIDACALSSLASRRADELSGGEVSRVHVARALASEAPILLADEPVAALDPRHQFQVMALLRRYVDAGHSALVVLHEAALAAQFADRLLWLANGVAVADGSPSETLNADRLRQVYAIDAEVLRANGAWAVTVHGPA